MDVENRQEDDDFSALLIEVQILVYFFDAHDLAVGRRQQRRIVFRNRTMRIPEKIGEIQGEQRRNRRRVGVDEIPCQHGQQRRNCDEYIAIFNYKRFIQDITSNHFAPLSRFTAATN